MQTFKKEIATILTTLSGSQWATHPEVQQVLYEYQHLAGAGKTPTGTRRVSLQIFHASRAIDTFLAHLASHEAAKPGRPAPPNPRTLGSSLRYIRQHHIGGHTFTTATDSDIHALTQDRNLYLHVANLFPADTVIRRFLLRTVLAIKEAATFPP